MTRGRAGSGIWLRGSGSQAWDTRYTREKGGRGSNYLNIRRRRRERFEREYFTAPHHITPVTYVRPPGPDVSLAARRNGVRAESSDTKSDDGSASTVFDAHRHVVVGPSSRTARRVGGWVTCARRNGTDSHARRRRRRRGPGGCLLYPILMSRSFISVVLFSSGLGGARKINRIKSSPTGSLV